MVDNNIGAMARQMAQKAGITTTNDSTARVRIQHLVKTGVQGSFMAAIKALVNMSQVQEPTDSTTREITWPGMNTHYSGDVEVSGTVHYENGVAVGQNQENVTAHYADDIPEEK